MYFDFEDYRPDITPVGSAISWREGVLVSIIVHLLGFIGLLLAPDIMPASEPTATEVRNVSPRDDPERFVFVAPSLDTPARQPPPPSAPASDQDRVATAPEIAPVPDNDLPRSEGNTFERVEPIDVEPGGPEAGMETVEPPTDVESNAAEPNAQGDRGSVTLPGDDGPELQARLGEPRRPPGGRLGDALRNLERYVQPNRFDNRQGGGGSFGPAIQFDTKGVEFGPWIRRFIAQVRRNWEPLIPQAAWSMHGHVIVTFNVHKSGRISDLSVVKPAELDAFNTAAYGALASSNPTVPLPSEYPSDQAFFTVTFFYNEQPPER